MLKNMLCFEGLEEPIGNVGISIFNVCKYLISSIFRLSLLWYFTVIAPFFAFEDSNLTNELNEAIDIMNEFNDLYGKSSFFLFFRGRIERCVQFMII